MKVCKIPCWAVCHCAISHVLQVLQRLQAKRTILEKELAKFPGAPSGTKDVFHLCRGFERVFCHTVEVGAPATCPSAAVRCT